MSKNVVTRNLKKGAVKALDAKAGGGALRKLDQAAGLLVPEKLKAHIPKELRSNKIISEGVSLVQAADEGLIDGSAILQQMQKLAAQSAANAIPATDRAKVAAEFEALKLELRGIVESAEHDGKRLFDGTVFQLDRQVAAPAPIGKVLEAGAPVPTVKSSAFNVDLVSLGVFKGGILSQKEAQFSGMQVARAADLLHGARSQLAAFQGNLVSSAHNLLTNSVDSLAARALKHPGLADERALQAKQKILGEAGKALLTQANSSARSALALV